MFLNDGEQKNCRLKKEPAVTYALPPVVNI